MSTNEHGPTGRFRRQHDDLTRLGFQLASMLSPEVVQRRSVVVRRLVARFAGKVLIHAAMENEALYPRLLAHEDEQVRACARSLFDDARELYDAVRAFSARWPSPSSLGEAPEVFAAEAMALLCALGMRIGRENDELYALVERAG
jgi:Hemerythrin HHE cation binding domain